jgi:hypothetical protein
VKTRFPLDIAVALFGPFIILAIAIIGGDAILGLSQIRHRALVAAILGIQAVLLICIFWVRQRQRKK